MASINSQATALISGRSTITAGSITSSPVKLLVPKIEVDSDFMQESNLHTPPALKPLYSPPDAPHAKRSLPYVNKVKFSVVVLPYLVGRHPTIRVQVPKKAYLDYTVTWFLDNMLEFYIECCHLARQVGDSSITTTLLSCIFHPPQWSNDKKRHETYTKLAKAAGYIGERRRLPEKLVEAVRVRYPSADGKYTGFRASKA